MKRLPHQVICCYFCNNIHGSHGIYRFSNKDEKQRIEKLCENIPVIDLDKEIVEKVIQIRQQNKIKLPDAIILATALINNFELITANISDFSNIHDDLVIIDPMK